MANGPMGGFMPTPAAPSQPPPVKLDTTATSRGNFNNFLKSMNGASSMTPLAPSGMGAMMPQVAPSPTSDIDIFNEPVQMMQQGGTAGNPLSGYGDYLSQQIDSTQVEPFIQEVEQMANERFNLGGDSGSLPQLMPFNPPQDLSRPKIEFASIMQRPAAPFQMQGLGQPMRDKDGILRQSIFQEPVAREPMGLRGGPEMFKTLDQQIFNDGFMPGTTQLTSFDDGGEVQNFFSGGEIDSFVDSQDSGGNSYNEGGEFSDTDSLDTFTGGGDSDDNDDPREDTLGVFENKNLASQLQELDRRPLQLSGGIMSQIPSFLTTGLNFAEQKAKDFILSDLASGNYDPIYDDQGRITGSRDRNTGAVRSGMDFNETLSLGDDSDEPFIKPLISEKEEEKEDKPPNVIGGIDVKPKDPLPTVVASPFAPATSKIEPISFDSGQLNKLIELLTGVPARPIVSAAEGGLIRAVDDFLSTGQ